MVGAVGVTFSILLLAWAGSLGHLSASVLSNTEDEDTSTTFTGGFAVLSICTLSLALQPLQVALRAIMLDQCPAEQQLHAQSWATRLSGMGQIIGSAAGLLYLPSSDSTGEIATFRIISVVAILAVSTSAALTCLGVEEHSAHPKLQTRADWLWFFGVAWNLARTFTRTSPAIRRVFLIQVLAWMGWYGFLFYNTRYASGRRVMVAVLVLANCD